jgi:6-pyruvoyltetrahydropterin/6-carboxytetrahydropterin synthase
MAPLPAKSPASPAAWKAMFELSRIVRFCIDLAADEAGGARDVQRHNTFAGHPPLTAVGVFYELLVRIRGEPDPATGYLLNISAIDRAVRARAVPIVTDAVRRAPGRDAAAVLHDVVRALRSELKERLFSVRWTLTPYYSLTMRTDAMSRVMLSQSFDFAAAHRLHCPAMSDEENRAVFGRCNNPNGHGHNYRLQVDASTPLDPAAGDGGGRLMLPALEKIVDETVIRRFDHTHLNLDTVEFAAINPSVENIARVCHGLLAGPIAAAGARLERITVWETDRTSCTYPAC